MPFPDFIVAGTRGLLLFFMPLTPFFLDVVHRFWPQHFTTNFRRFLMKIIVRCERFSK
jgi:hypothetical protein